MIPPGVVSKSRKEQRLLLLIYMENKNNMWNRKERKQRKFLQGQINRKVIVVL